MEHPIPIQILNRLRIQTIKLVHLQITKKHFLHSGQIRQTMGSTFPEWEWGAMSIHLYYEIVVDVFIVGHCQILPNGHPNLTDPIAAQTKKDLLCAAPSWCSKVTGNNTLL